MSDEYDYGELLVLQHGEAVGVGHLQRSLDERAQRRPWRAARVDRGDAPAVTDDTRGILVLGGFQAAYDPHPWLPAELDAIRDAVEAGIPVFGICLGAQLLAAALGGEVAQREVPEVGIIALTRTLGGQEDEVFAGWPDHARQVFLHEDQITELPDGAVVMLEGSDGAAAWRAPDGVSYGVQFHPEASAEMVAQWVASQDAGVVARAGVDGEAFVAQVREHEAFLRGAGAALVCRWIDAVVGADDPVPRKPR